MTNSQPSPLSSAHIRIARPTDRLQRVVEFYTDALGFEELGRFQDHDGFDGVMLGHAECGYHLEFTTCQGHQAGLAPGPENLLVFYVPDRSQWQQVVDRLQSAGCEAVPSFNPYWDEVGQTYEDPDGYRVVIQRATWPAA